MEIAEKEIGEKEIYGNSDNPRILEYHKATTLKAQDDEVPWCSAFVCWVMTMAGFESTRSAAARSWLQWGKEVTVPYDGCIVVLKRGNPPNGHVGFYKKDLGNGLIQVLGGNQMNSVCLASKNKSDVLSYREPVILG